MEKERNIINPKDEGVISHIDMTLEDYDRIIETANWEDLLTMVSQGLITQDMADKRYYDWFMRRHGLGDNQIGS